MAQGSGLAGTESSLGILCELHGSSHFDDCVAIVRGVQKNRSIAGSTGSTPIRLGGNYHHCFSCPFE